MGAAAANGNATSGFVGERESRRSRQNPPAFFLNHAEMARFLSEERSLDVRCAGGGGGEGERGGGGRSFVYYFCGNVQVSWLRTPYTHQDFLVLMGDRQVASRDGWGGERVVLRVLLGNAC